MSRSTESSRPAIAVVGVSALFPGSLDATGFWNDILDGNDLITDVPPTHWLIEDYYDPDPSVPDKTYAKRGAFLSDVDFDSLGWASCSVPVDGKDERIIFKRRLKQKQALPIRQDLA